jgi:hypothetical protein
MPDQTLASSASPLEISATRTAIHQLTTVEIDTKLLHHFTGEDRMIRDSSVGYPAA